MQRDANEVLVDILTSIAFITEDMNDVSLDQFLQDRRTQQLVERNFEIIGEALNRLARHHLSVVEHISDYEQIISFRNAIIHGYDNISYRRVWQNIQNHLPVLRTEVEALLAKDQSQRDVR